MTAKIDKITLSDSAIERVTQIRQKPENQGKFLRIKVDSGGCSGFQYLFNLLNLSFFGKFKTFTLKTCTLTCLLPFP